MTQPVRLPGNPQLSTDADIWGNQQRLDLINLWKEIGRIFNLTARGTGATGPIASGTTITHNLGTTPSFVLVTPIDGALVNVAVQNITKTTFQIVFSGGGTHSFGWSAEQ